MPPNVRIDGNAFLDARFELLGKLLGTTKYDALGRMAWLWQHCTARNTHVLSEQVVELFVDVEAVILSGLAERVENGIRVAGTVGRIEWYEKLKLSGKRGSEKRWNRGGYSHPISHPNRVAIASREKEKEKEISYEISSVCSSEKEISEGVTPPEKFPEGSGVKPRPKKPKPSEPTRDELSVVERVLERLSSRTGREYRPTTKIHAQRILRLLREGYGEHDLRLVVWHKANEWSDNERMAPYLRPSTLFGPEKFPEYLAESKAADAAAERSEKPALPAAPIHATISRLLGGGS